MHAIITGSTKGLGKCLAEEFLKRGHQVVISSRTAENVQAVTLEFQETYGDEKVLGITADVAQ